MATMRHNTSGAATLQSTSLTSRLPTTGDNADLEGPTAHAKVGEDTRGETAAAVPSTDSAVHLATLDDPPVRDKPNHAFWLPPGSQGGFDSHETSPTDERGERPRVDTGRLPVDPAEGTTLVASVGGHAMHEAVGGHRTREERQRIDSIFRRSNMASGRPRVDDSDMSDGASEMDDRHHRISVPGWPGDPTYRKSNDDFGLNGQDDYGSRKTEGSRQSVHKVARQKGVSSGRTYTSKYRGVHQTFPTKRWEAQFRRNGKPTSLGCFDQEEEAAHAYDSMMVWCELHGQDSRGGGSAKGIAGRSVSASISVNHEPAISYTKPRAPQPPRAPQVPKGHKSSFTTLPLNFEYGEYEGDFDRLRHITQDDLVQNLRRQGRLQAATNTGGVPVMPPISVAVVVPTPRSPPSSPDLLQEKGNRALTA
eukprot:CAMPEP_0181357156 /NCGR_PEP_ID=MMETSP1106-20121128/4802_1 /TAXON_ID=81844 /ORGANISM="Mantoniella antarctica, Strain SL-175" /LENGTH=420 /DNA_ID=CAMNT_0023469983 /DNA_START=148 /DNA_END=1411 /DNA_ORIENTATION=+